MSCYQVGGFIDEKTYKERMTKTTRDELAKLTAAIKTVTSWWDELEDDEDGAAKVHAIVMMEKLYVG